MPKGRRELSNRSLPESLTRHLSDPKGKIAKTPDGRRRPYRLSGAAMGLATSVVTLVIIVLAGGHVLRAW
ncbi:hypothetical protein MKL09_06315 [Methylobacterium sp. J-048]|uniref:hypothetical protein n=1 Tax=Methylobacterium sp. J-048 TaxID=2836635 RepID=UPI001FBACDE2|nr:hypothetical protein [Methylobacterium sp. J-048]MCJ2056160.1 hypothetical protein [Methylobacterium sp. J-048]